MMILLGRCSRRYRLMFVSSSISFSSLFAGRDKKSEPHLAPQVNLVATKPEIDTLLLQRTSKETVFFERRSSCND